MTHGKLATAILNGDRLGHQVWPLPGRSNMVAVGSQTACGIARKLATLGLVSYQSQTEHNVAIGRNWDGSTKYGTVWMGVVTLNQTAI